MLGITVLIAAVLLYPDGCAWSAEAKLSPAETAAAFRAAGYKAKGTKWFACAEGHISEVRDINGDGLLEVLITESGTACHGMTGAGYSLVSKQSNGTWKLVSGGTGIVTFLKGPTVRGWPDMEIGGPGFCFPVHRWHGEQYVFNRSEYEGKRCKP
jgi:hypothetical protein